MQAELGTEIGDQVIVCIKITINLIMGDFIQVAVVGRHDPVVFFHEDIVFSRCIYRLLGDTA